jgi:uncharacterized protein (TIGR00725 family)
MAKSDESAVAKYVAISGPGESASSDEKSRAYEAAGQLVSSGCVLLTGGLEGVMGAAAAGAKAAGGTSIGFLPGLDRSEANSDLSFALPTGMGELRNGLLVRAADAILIIGGSWGTLSEYAMAERTGVPVVTLGGWAMDPRAEGAVPTCASVTEAVQSLLALI